MEGVAAEATPPAEDRAQQEDCGAIFPPQMSVSQQDEPPELAAASAQLCSHHEDGDVSDATESADSEDEEDPPSGTWTLRRSSSSSVHSGEDAHADTLETRRFMKAYVLKVFNGM